MYIEDNEFINFLKQLEKDEQNIKHKSISVKKKLYILVCIALMYAAVTTTIYRFVYPSKTQTQLFLDIPKALTWNYNEK